MGNEASFKLIEILHMSTDYLAKKGIENARLNAELVVGYILQLNRVQLYLNFEKPVAPDELARIRSLLKRRANHEPIQYILEETEFYSLKLKVNRSTLIPRPETEILVDAVLNCSNQITSQTEFIQILDIGTGSGNIAIALAKYIANSKITAIDSSGDTIVIARQNASHHHLDDRINFLQHDIFDIERSFPTKFDVIVSNPPYISKKDFDWLPVEIKNYEPKAALDGGADGLKFYRQLIAIAPTLLAQDGFVAVEIGANQSENVKKIFAIQGFFRYIEVINDLNHLPRVVLAKTKNS